MRTTLSLLLFTAACGDNLPGPVEDDPSTSTGRSLTGSQVAEWKSYDGSIYGETPNDFWDTVIEAHVADGDGWRVVPGTGHRDGSFIIEGLPDGHVWLRLARRPFGEAFYWTDAEHVSFDEPLLGPEEARSADEGDQMKLAVDGLAPWQESDALAWFVPEDIVYDQNVLSPAPPTAGTTDLAGLEIDWTGRALANVGPNEPSFLVQYRTQTLGDDVEVIAPVRAASPKMNQAAGTTGTLAATLTAPAVLPYRLAWARDAFEAERTAAHPTRAGEGVGHSFGLVALPGLVDGEQWLSVEYPLATLTDPSILAGTTPLDLGTLNVPNPFPRSWIADSYIVTFPVDFPLPNGDPWTLEASIGRRSLDLSTDTTPARPVVTAVRTPTIGGRDAHAPLTEVGLAPTVAWTAPATGTATSYQLRLIRAVMNPPPPFRSGWYVDSELTVPGDVTSIRLPADVLKRDETYGIVVRSIAQPGQDARTRPWRTGGTAAFAETILGPFSP